MAACTAPALSKLGSLEKKTKNYCPPWSAPIRHMLDEERLGKALCLFGRSDLFFYLKKTEAFKNHKTLQVQESENSTSFSRSLSFSVPGSPVRLRGGALRLPVAVKQKFNNSQTGMRHPSVGLHFT